jgi:dUTP pyrophosphatase
VENNKIAISLTEIAAQVLHQLEITPENYGPAYNGESAGLDLYNCGEEVIVPGRTKWSVFGEPSILIATGLKMNVPQGFVGLVKERGSIFKTGLLVRGGVIDPGFSGEIFVNLVNMGNRDVSIQTGAKLPLQLIVVPCLAQFEVISNLDFLEKTRDHHRQEGSVGSSDLPTQPLLSEELEREPIENV